MRKKHIWLIVGSVIVLGVILLFPIQPGSSSGACATSTTNCDDHDSVDYANPANLLELLIRFMTGE